MFTQTDLSQQFIQEILARGLNYQHLYHFKTASSLERHEQLDSEVTMLILAPDEHMGCQVTGR